VVCSLLAVTAYAFVLRKTSGPMAGVTAQGVTNLDSLTLGQDLVVGRKATVAGLPTLNNGLEVKGNFTNTSNGTMRVYAVVVSGTLDVAGVSTLAGGYTWTGQGTAGNGLQVTGTITQTSGTALLNSASVTGTLGVGGLLSPANGVDVGGNVTVTHLVDAAAINASALFTAAASSVTGAETVGGLLTASNGLTASSITSTAGITVGTYVGALSYYGAISSTVGITNSEVVQVTGKMVIPLSVSDGAVGGSILGTLDATNSLSDGAYNGQLLILINLDADADTIMVKNGANTAIGKDRTLDVGDVMTLYWDGPGSVWRLVSILDTSA